MCEKCHDTGKLPVPGYVHGFFNCSCTPQEYGTYRERQLQDFDFPCSDTFRGFYQDEPATNHQVSGVSSTEQVIVHRHSNMSQLESVLLQHVSKTLEQHLNYKKPQPKPAESKGMMIE